MKREALSNVSAEVLQAFDTLVVHRMYALAALSDDDLSRWGGVLVELRRRGELEIIEESAGLRVERHYDEPAWMAEHGR